MQVNDCPPAPPTGTAGKEEVRSVADEGGGPRAAASRGRGFARRSNAGGATRPAEAPTTGLQRRPWRGGFAPSRCRRARRLRRRRASPGWRHRAPSIGSSIGSGPDGAQARIRIGAGALAGTEIHLSSASGQTVEARLLTHAASSRQTLSVVMDEIRSRLRDRGIVLATRRCGRASPPAQASEVGVGDGAAVTPGMRCAGGGGPVNARAFDLGTCPRVRARQARATRAVLRACALLPERWSVELPPLGSATMTFAGYDSDPDRVDAAELAVSFGAGRGRVSVESSFAARLVDTVLGGGAVFSTARSIGPAESRRSGRRARARVRSHRRQPATRSRARRARAEIGISASVLFRLETVVASGWLRLTPPAGDSCRASTAPTPGARGRGAFRSRAVSRSRRRACRPARWRGVAVGDAVVFDGVRAATFAASRCVELPASRRRSCR